LLLVAEGLGDVGHVAGDALAAWTVLGVMGVLGDSPFQASGIVFGVAAEAERVAGGDQVRGIAVAVYLMAVEAAQPPVIHVALHEVVALHPVFVRAGVGKVIEVL